MLSVFVRRVRPATHHILAIKPGLRNVFVVGLSTTSCLYAKRSIREKADKRTERYMRKTIDMLTGRVTTGKRKSWIPNVDPVDGGFSSNSSSVARSKSVASHGNVKRAQQLSIVFFDYISNLINSGEVCPRLLELGFHITKVQMQKDFGHLSVYWLQTDTIGNDNEILSLLPGAGADLRLALTGLRVIGNVPAIQFVKDTALSRAMLVEHLIQIADKGPPLEDDQQNESDDSDDNNKSMNSMTRVHSIYGAKPKSLQESFEAIGSKFEQLDLRSLADRRPDSLIEVGSARNIHQNDIEEKSAFKISEDENISQSPAALSDIRLRSDIYGLDRDLLIDQILRMKRRSRDRSYDQSTTMTSNANNKEMNRGSTRFTEKSSKRNKPGRLNRDEDEYTSSNRYKEEEEEYEHSENFK